MATTTTPNLPEELLLEIFTRIPAKSVGRCRCLSKLWLTNLSTPQFINLHLTRTKSHPEENLLLISHVRALHTIPLPITDEAVSKELSGLPQSWKMVLGSCNGLVLLLNVEDELFLVNPVTQQQVRVPHPPLPYPKQEKFGQLTTVDEMYGFGYDISNDDYKILCITTFGYHTILVEKVETYAHVCSLKMGVWRRVPLPCDFRCKGILNGGVDAGAHVNGVIHWLTREALDDPYVLATFDMADEVFGLIPLPDDDNGMCEVLTVSVLRGCLVLMRDREMGRVVEVCIMKEYGVQESWTTFSFSIKGAGLIKFKPLCFIGENEAVILRNGSLRLSNLKMQEMKKMVVNGADPYFNDGCEFSGSLVSPSSFTLVAEEKHDGTDSANNTLEAGPSQAQPGSSG